MTISYAMYFSEKNSRSVKTLEFQYTLATLGYIEITQKSCGDLAVCVALLFLDGD
jgi:hypothetical protein